MNFMDGINLYYYEPISSVIVVDSTTLRGTWQDDISPASKPVSPVSPYSAPPVLRSKNNFLLTIESGQLGLRTLARLRGVV